MSCVGWKLWAIVWEKRLKMPSCPITSDALAAAKFFNDHGGADFTVKNYGTFDHGIDFLDITGGDSKDLWRVFNYARIHWGGGLGLIFGPGRTHVLRVDGRHETRLRMRKTVYIIHDDGKNPTKIIYQSSPEFATYYQRAKAEYLSEQAQDPEKPIITVDDVTGGLDRIERLGIIAAVIVVGVLGWRVLARIPKSTGKTPGPKVKHRSKRYEDAKRIRRGRAEAPADS